MGRADKCDRPAVSRLDLIECVKHGAERALIHWRLSALELGFSALIEVLPGITPKVLA